MNEETKQSDIKEIENSLEETGTESQVEDVLPEKLLPEETLPEEYDEPFANAELPDDELALEDEFPSELDLGDHKRDSETESETIRIIASDESVTIDGDGQAVEATTEAAARPEAAEEQITATREELKPAIESLLFVADEPLPFKQLCKVMGDVPEEDVLAALHELGSDYEARSSGLEVREIAGGWRISTRPQNHEFIRKYLKSRPSARLSLPALETLAVIAYKQPITIPEILEIRGVTSSSAIKTLLEKRLIITKGRKETVGKPMLYGTSKEFLIQFGLKDLTELPSIEDFEDLSQ
ncbi:MAG: SMC-Scp complex subunit ScpB [Acidobacteriota bacterium]|nr:SMC-Scp complex subunit ScpB [Acidobacteriota bacterium]